MPGPDVPVTNDHDVGQAAEPYITRVSREMVGLIGRMAQKGENPTALLGHLEEVLDYVEDCVGSEDAPGWPSLSGGYSETAGSTRDRGEHLLARLRYTEGRFKRVIEKGTGAVRDSEDLREAMARLTPQEREGFVNWMYDNGKTDPDQHVTLTENFLSQEADAGEDQPLVGEEDHERLRAIRERVETDPVLEPLISILDQSFPTGNGPMGRSAPAPEANEEAEHDAAGAGREEGEMEVPPEDAARGEDSYEAMYDQELDIMTGGEVELRDDGASFGVGFDPGDYSLDYGAGDPGGGNG